MAIATPARTLAITLIVVAMVIAIYSLGSYFRRLYLLQHGKQYGYIDHLAPVTLTFACLYGIGCFLYYTIETSQPINVMYVQKDECIKIQYNGISNLVFQPSDIAIKTKIAYIPSGNQILAIDLKSRSMDTDGSAMKESSFVEDQNYHLQTVAKIIGTDIEGLVWIDDTLFALCEDDNILYALHWKNGTEHITSGESMQIIGR